MVEEAAYQEIKYKMKQQKTISAMLLLAFLAGGTAYFCSRGSDVNVEFLPVWLIIGIIHCFVDCQLQKRFFNLQMLGIYGAAFLIGFSQSELDEMAGILYYIVPLVALAVCIISEIIKWIYRSQKKN